MAEKEMRHLVRIANTDLDGTKPIYSALTQIKGVSWSFANMVCNLLHLEKKAQVGFLEDKKIEQIDSFLKDAVKHGAPVWMLNRRRDLETGSDFHLLAADIDFVVDNDLKRMKMIKSYKGVRHIQGLPARGQKTKSNFRKNKGHVLGVKRRAGAKVGK